MTTKRKRRNRKIEPIKAQWVVLLVVTVMFSLLTVLDFSFENAFTGATSHQGFGGNLPNAPISTTCFDMKLLDGTGDLASPDFQDTSPGGQLQKEPLRKYYTQQYRKQICENMGCTFIGFEGTEKFNFNTKIDLSNDACKGLPKRCPDSASYKFVGKEANTARSLLCSQAKCNYKDGGNIFPTNDRCGEPPAYCYNQNDDDGDGFTDCEDHDCDLSINCAKEICDDGKDNNANSKIDCDDQACYDSNLCDSFCDSCNDDCIKVSEKYQCVECESDSTCENSPAYGSGYVCNKNKCEKDTSQAICGGCNDDCAEKNGKWSCVDCATDSYCQDSGQYGNTFQCTNNKCVEKLIYAHYKFEENGKNSVTPDDFVDVKFDGEKFVSGVNAKSLQLAGTTSSSGLFDVDLLHGRKDFSVSIWMKPEKLDVGVLSGAKKDNDNEFGIYLNGDKRIWVGFEGSQKYMKNPGLELNKWSQIILTRSGKIVALYFNGKKVDTLAVKENALNIDRFYLGQEIDLKVNGQPKSGQKGIDGTPYSTDPNQAFKGKLDELKFFSKALTGLEASTIYNQEKLKVNLDTGDTCKSDDECKKGLACDFSNNNICLGGEGYDCSYQSSGKDGFCATGLKCIAEGNSYVCKGDFEICDNKIDDNKDGKADCLDSECNGKNSCEFDKEISCSDSKDNDGDGFSDCLDTDCAGKGSCEEMESSCTDGKNNDGDMGKEYDYDADYEVDAALFDCYDPGCKAFCKKYECESLYNYDDYDGGTTSCKKQPPKEECTNGKDDDFDGKIDCQDSNCDQNKCGKLQDTFCTEYSCKIGLVCLDSNYNVKMCLKPKGGSCSHPDECGKGFSCVNGVCSLKGVGESCNFNGDCDSGFCEGGKCVGNEGDLCKAPSECKKGLSCLTIGGKLVCADASKVSKDDTDGDGVLDALENPKCISALSSGVKRVYPAGAGYPAEFVGCLWGDFNHDGILCADDHSKYLDQYLTVFDKQLSVDKKQFDLKKDALFDANDHSRYLDNYLNEFAKYTKLCKS